MRNETDIARRIGLQNAEFDAVQKLAEQYRRIQMTPPVDDDYPVVRHDYESAMRTVVDAIRANGRLPSPGPITGASDEVHTELTRAMANWPAFNSAHEGWGVLSEEMDELWQHVRTNQKRRDLTAMRKEAIQVAAMAMRFAIEVCNETTGRK